VAYKVGVSVRLTRLVAWTVALIVAACGAAQAEETALVEDIAAPSVGIQFMDYLGLGQVIHLRPGERIVIDYLRSCWREEIAGGNVTVGAEQSVVTGGVVRREKVECDGGKMLLTAEQASKSGVVVFRNIPTRNQAQATKQASVMLYGASPLIDVKDGGRVAIERLDQPGDSRVVEISVGKARSHPYDFAKHGQALTPGGTYRATCGGNEIVFRIADTAKPGPSSVIGRLLRF
jgi:hypothetical protein